MMRCRANTVGQCNDNVESFFEKLHCERFRKDETGPWFMLSNGMSDAHCGEKMVISWQNLAELVMKWKQF